MSRVLLALVVAISVVSCSKSGGDEAAAVAPNATGAGKVLEVSGKVTVKGKQLAVGQMLAADDVVETGDDGHVVIELQHNLAHWDLGAGKSQRVSESIAWKLPKSEGNSQFVIRDMSAAGRPAEKTAANGGASAPSAPAPAPALEQGAAPPTNQPAPPPPPTAAAVAPKAESKTAPLKADVGAIGGRGGAGLSAGAGGGAAAPGGSKGGGLAGIGTTSATGAGAGAGASAGESEKLARAPRMASAEQLVERQEPALKACLAKGATVKLHVAVDATGKAVTTVDDADAKTTGCLVAAIKKLTFPAEKANVNMTIENSNR